MSKKITVSYATYEKLAECQEILKTDSDNMTVVELALLFLRNHKQKRVKSP